jgi:hypothetical protein
VWRGKVKGRRGTKGIEVVEGKYEGGNDNIKDM